MNQTLERLLGWQIISRRPRPQTDDELVEMIRENLRRTPRWRWFFLCFGLVLLGACICIICLASRLPVTEVTPAWATRGLFAVAVILGMFVGLNLARSLEYIAMFRRPGWRSLRLLVKYYDLAKQSGAAATEAPSKTARKE